MGCVRSNDLKWVKQRKIRSGVEENVDLYF